MLDPTDPTKPKPVPQDTAKARISRNVDKMASQGASDAEIEEYIQSEGLKPVGSSGNIDMRAQSESTRVTPAKPQPDQPGATEGLLDRGLDMLTGGLHPKIQGIGTAIGDALTHGVNAHPVDSYRQGDVATRERMQAAKTAHPIASKAADATGFFGGIALGGSAAKALGMANAAPAASAVQRIKDAGRVGFGVGAVGSGLASEGDLQSRLLQTGIGGALGGALGLGVSTGAEGVRLAKNFFAPVAEKAEELANTQIAERLRANGLSANELPRRAAQAQQAGNSKAVVAHLGGPALDPLTYVASSSPSPEGVALQEGITGAQRGERDVLQHGVTAMSGRENAPRNSATNFLQSLEDQRGAAGAVDYPKAYAAPPISDPRVLDAIANEPYLSGSLDKSVDILNRKSRATALRTGEPAAEIVNPLTDRDNGPSGVEAQLTSLYGNDPIKLALARQKAGLPPAPVSSSGSIPVQMLDKLQQAAQPGIERGLSQGHLAAEDAGAINSQLQSILRMADESSPDFQAARSRQASFFGRQEGGQAGLKALDKTGPGIANDITAFDRPGQAEAYRTTATSKLRDAIDAKGYGADVGRSLFDNPEREAQLDALFGPGARERLQPSLNQSSTLNRVMRASAGSGSQTDPRRVAREALAPEEFAGDVAKLLHSPKRRAWNIPAKIIDARSKAVQDAAIRNVAEKLGISVDNPGLAEFAQLLGQPQESQLQQFSAPGPFSGLFAQFVTRKGVGQ